MTKIARKGLDHTQCRRKEMKVKYFSENTGNELESVINDFIIDKKVINIQFLENIDAYVIYEETKK
jgi:hypothetical protein